MVGWSEYRQSRIHTYMHYTSNHFFTFSQMLKFITKVQVGFAPMSLKSRPARTFLNQIKTTKNQAINKKCQFDIQIKDNISKPFIKVTFENGHLFDFNLEDETVKAKELVLEIKNYSKRLQLEQDIANSS